jgi:acetyl esterase/lipase
VSELQLVAVVAPGVLADPGTAEGVFARALAARGVTGRFVTTGSPTEFHAAVADASATGEVLVLLPGDAAAVDDQVAAGLPLGGARVVRVDLDERGPDRSGAVLRHVRGRGLDGLRFAVDAWHFPVVSPARTVAYGPDPDQRGELRVPEGAGPFPVAVLVHGGYWRSRWENDLSEPMAVDLLSRGFATWNVEYRRPAEAGWAGTTADVAASLEALATIADEVPAVPLDLGRVVTLGHSAGGQLVVRLAADVAADPTRRVRPALTVSQAGVLDLVTADRRWLGEGAVSAALGGRADDVPALYAASSPVHRLPIGAPVAVVVGRGDNLDLLDVSRAYVAAARACGDDVEFVEDEGNHFSVIDPSTSVWERTVELVQARLAP